MFLIKIMKMKNVVAWGAVVILAMAGCTNEEVLTTNQGQGIEIGKSYVANSTRADFTPITNDGIREFYLYGGYETNMTHVFDGVKVSSTDGSAWTYEGDTRYWVNGKTYKFAAYAPEAVNSVVSSDFNNGVLIFTNYNSGPDNQHDLIYATKEYTAKESANTALNLSFKHMLSQVYFTFYNNLAKNITIRMTGVKLAGVKSQASHDGQYTDPSDRTILKDWNLGSETVDYIYDDVESKSTGSSLQDPVSTKKYAMIPQKEGSFTFTFTLSIINELGTQISSEDKRFTITPNWEMGKSYQYIVMINGSEAGMEQIVIGDPTVGAWENNGSGTVLSQD